MCLPREPRLIFHIQKQKYEGNISSSDKIHLAFTCLKKQLPLQAEEESIIKNVSNLLNSVHEVQAIAELRKKQEQPELL